MEVDVRTPQELAWKVRARLPGQERTRRALYWESRAPELIATYADPRSWPAKRCLRSGVEDRPVPRILDRAGVQSVVVVGCGAGREFDYLAPAGFDLAGFDISPTMIAECRRRHPTIDVRVTSVVGCDRHFLPVDAVVSSAVLAHVPPDEIEDAMRALQRIALKMIVLREKTRFDEVSDYQWEHDYEKLLAGWGCTHRELTDEGDTFAAELMAWERRS